MVHSKVVDLNCLFLLHEALHVLPTAGSARFASGLSVYDFYKKTSVIKMSKQGLEKIGRSAIHLANYEGLFAHSQSIRIRIS